MMDNNSKQGPLKIDFGSLGSVKISELEYETPHIFAKLPSSVSVSCPGGGTAMDSGPTMDDDAGCMVPFTV